MESNELKLDNLKEAWTALDNRLKRNEELNESIILEMIQIKAVKKVNWFIALEILSVSGLLLALPLCIYLFDKGNKYLVVDLCMLFTAAICVVFTFWGVYKLHGLMKFDLTKNVGNNIFCMNRYNIQIKREKKIFVSFVYPAFVVFGVACYAAHKATLHLWAFLICVLVLGGLITYWSYKKYDKGIASILKSLDEIRELKEE